MEILLIHKGPLLYILNWVGDSIFVYGGNLDFRMVIFDGNNYFNM